MTGSDRSARCGTYRTGRALNGSAPAPTGCCILRRPDVSSNSGHTWRRNDPSWRRSGWSYGLVHNPLYPVPLLPLLFDPLHSLVSPDPVALRPAVHPLRRKDAVGNEFHATLLARVQRGGRASPVLRALSSFQMADKHSFGFAPSLVRRHGYGDGRFVLRARPLKRVRADGHEGVAFLRPVAVGQLVLVHVGREP